MTIESDLVRGDQVRIRILKNMNTKSSSPQFSNEIYTVTYQNGNKIKLSDGNTYKRYSLLKVASVAKPILYNKQKQIKNARNVHKQLKLLDQEEYNIPVNEPRQKRNNAGKPPTRYRP